MDQPRDFVRGRRVAAICSGGITPVRQSIIVNTISMSGGNISQPATSSVFSNGAGLSGDYIVQ